MIRGYDLRGEEVATFNNVVEMAGVMDEPLDELIAAFEDNRQFTLNDMFFHYDNVETDIYCQDPNEVVDENPDFDLEFGYPEPKLTTMAGEREMIFTGRMVKFTAPAGSIIVTPHDEIYGACAEFFEEQEKVQEAAATVSENNANDFEAMAKTLVETLKQGGAIQAQNTLTGESMVLETEEDINEFFLARNTEVEKVVEERIQKESEMASTMQDTLGHTTCDTAKSIMGEPFSLDLSSGVCGPGAGTSFGLSPEEGGRPSMIDDAFELVARERTPLLDSLLGKVSGDKGRSMNTEESETIGRRLQAIASDESNLGSQDGGNYSENGSSAHYKSALVEYIDDIELKHGTVMAYMACVNNTDKYRGRAGKKEGVSIEKDLVKARWYESCGQHLKGKIEAYQSGNAQSMADFWAQNGCRPYIPMTAHVGELYATEIEEILESAHGMGQTLTQFFSRPSLGQIVDRIQG
jgi:hypothetical protein